MQLRPEHLAARVPRYTSYPTAPHFDASVGEDRFREWLAALPQAGPLSLYVHIPFCKSLCWFCGCHTRAVNTYAPVSAYATTLLRELDLVRAALGPRRKLGHVHFGGGSPTLLSPDDFARLSDRIHESFDFAPGAEFAVEIDPRTLTGDAVTAFARAGVNRASLGVQDVNPEVQRAVNRIQPVEVTRDAAAALRDAGIEALNIDLMYGLPHQTAAGIMRTVEFAASLAPRRLAVFGYAHVPAMMRHQQLIDAAALPGPAERLRQYETAQAALLAAGYCPVGLDHFALASDPLALAQRKGTLSRNFQGYTTDTAGALVGIGASSISSLPQAYAQNAAATPLWSAKISAGRLATARGRQLTPEDRLRGAVIERLMCDLSADLRALAASHGQDPSVFTADRARLAPLSRQGLVRLRGHTVTVPENMRPAVRLVASAFDTYLHAAENRHALAV